MKYEGYWSGSKLPVKPGSTVRIKKGTMLRSMHPSKDDLYESGKTMTITVNHVLNGVSMPARDLLHERNRYGDHFPDLFDNVDWDEVEKTAEEHTVESHTRMFSVKNPRVVWAGAGGYWIDADINDVEIIE